MNNGRTIWITGISGAGKTTLAKALVDVLQGVVHPVLIDGDQIRALYGSDLGYDEKSRRVQIGRMQRLAKWLSDQGHVVVVAALYSHPELMQWNRENLKGYFEVYLDMPLAEVRNRDSKGLYIAAFGGQVINVVGVDIEWHEPLEPDLVFRLADVDRPENMARSVLAAMGDIDFFAYPGNTNESDGPADERDPTRSATIS